MTEVTALTVTDAVMWAGGRSAGQCPRRRSRRRVRLTATRDS